METCYFCKQEFANRQAVRAHLKACAAYLGRSYRQTALPEGNTDLPEGHLVKPSDDSVEKFDLVRQMRQNIATEKLRLQLREILDAHSERDAKEEASRRAAAEEARRETEARKVIELEREAAQMRAQNEAQSNQRAEEAKRQLAIKRREIIQDVKHIVVDQWLGGWSASAELKAKMLQSIEWVLAPLPVQELPKAELVQIAESVRDSIRQAEVNTKRNAQALAEQRQALQRYGAEYAGKELRDIEGLDYSEIWRIELLVKEELRELTGQESRINVKAWIDKILDEEGLSLVDEDEYE